LRQLGADFTPCGPTLDLPAVIATTRRAVEAADLADSFKHLLADM
jgi:hypothetical protein